MCLSSLYPFHCWATLSYVPEYQESVGYEGIRRLYVGLRSSLCSPVSLLDGEKVRNIPVREYPGLGLFIGDS